MTMPDEAVFLIMFVGVVIATFLIFWILALIERYKNPKKGKIIYPKDQIIPGESIVPMRYMPLNTLHSRNFPSGMIKDEEQFTPVYEVKIEKFDWHELLQHEGVSK